MQVHDWVTGRISELREPGADSPAHVQQAEPLDAEERLALTILQLYAPTPPPFLIRKLADWIRQHVGTLVCGSAQPQWMWSWILFLWTLNECGIHTLATNQPEHYHDLIAQLGAPAWARNSAPFVHWRRGRTSMTAGHLYAGMRRADGAGQSMEQLAPVLPQSIVDALQATVDGAQQALVAEPGAGEDEDVDHATNDTRAQTSDATSHYPPILPPPPSPHRPTPGPRTARDGHAANQIMARCGTSKGKPLRIPMSRRLGDQMEPWKSATRLEEEVRQTMMRVRYPTLLEDELPSPHTAMPTTRPI